MAANARVTVAVIKKEIEYLKQGMDKHDGKLDQIMDILTTGSGKIAKLNTRVETMEVETKTRLNTAYKIFGFVISLLAIAVTAIAALK